jgi:HD-like signal output (HDOD) protein
MSLTQSSALKRIQTHGQVPTLPEIMIRVLDVLEDEHSSADDITTILSSDPVITARVLRLANSAFFGARFQIDSIHRAVVTVGFEAVKQLTLATTVLQNFSRCSQQCLDPDDFWMHALGSAKAAQLVAFSARQITMPEACFTGGLLHDLGKLILSISLGAEYEDVLRRAAEEPCKLRVMEQRVLQTDHAEVGGWLMQQWGFPALVVSAIQNIYTPEIYTGPFQKEVRIVSLASDMARLAGFGHAGETAEPRLSSDCLDALGLDMQQAEEICETLAIMKDDARTLLGLFQQT